MHQLILLRHAQATRASQDVSDHDRPLAAEGRKAAAAIGAAMRRMGLTPDVVLVSSALRTLQTLDELEPWDDRPNIEILPQLYMASRTQIGDAVRELPETVRSVLVIGHNPGIHELAQLLAGDISAAPPEFRRLADEFPPTALAGFLVPTLWQKLGSTGTVLKQYIQADELR